MSATNGDCGHEYVHDRRGRHGNKNRINEKTHCETKRSVLLLLFGIK